MGGPLPPIHLSHALAAAAAEIDTELRRKPSKTMRLDPDAGNALADAHADYLGAVGRQSVRLARNDGMLNVDRVHVNKAVQQFEAGSTSGWANAWSTIGGIAVGGGLAGGYALFFTEGRGPAGAHSVVEFGVTLGLNVFGFIFLIIGLMMTIRK